MKKLTATDRRLLDLLDKIEQLEDERVYALRLLPRCPWCGVLYARSTAWQRFCTASCRTSAWAHERKTATDLLILILAPRLTNERARSLAIALTHTQTRELLEAYGYTYSIAARMWTADQ